MPSRFEIARKALCLKKLCEKLTVLVLACGRPVRLSADMWNTRFVFLVLSVAMTGAPI